MNSNLKFRKSNQDTKEKQNDVDLSLIQHELFEFPQCAQQFGGDTAVNKSLKNSCLLGAHLLLDGRVSKLGIK